MHEPKLEVFKMQFLKFVELKIQFAKVTSTNSMSVKDFPSKSKLSNEQFLINLFLVLRRSSSSEIVSIIFGSSFEASASFWGICLGPSGPCVIGFVAASSNFAES
ncbi:MAG: hypothetical protein N2035_00170 [Chthoniobacterales bacterium]|nr:hypothetical protein [Chthoniobacterales bacterium]